MVHHLLLKITFWGMFVQESQCVCVCHAVDGRHPSNMENHPWLLGFRSIESIYSIHLSTGAGIVSITTLTMWIHPTDQEAWSHRSSALWAWAYFVDPSLPGYETDHSLQPQIDTQTSIMGQRCGDVLDCRERLICIDIYIYIHTCGIHGWWLRLRSCTVFLAWKWTKLIPWPCNKHATDWGFDFFRAWSNKKNMCENEGAGGAGTGLLTQLALALALREDPVSCKKPITWRCCTYKCIYCNT